MAKTKLPAPKTKAPATKPTPPTRVSQSAVAKEHALHIQTATNAIALSKPLTAAQRHELIVGSNVSDDFLETAAQAYDALGKTSGADGFDSNVVRTAIAYKKSQGPVLASVQALVKAVEDKALAQYGGAGVAALDLYAQLKVKARGTKADPAVKVWLAKLAKASVQHRLDAAARKQATKQANKAKREQKQALKAATAAVKKPAKATGTQAPASPPAKANGGAQATN